MKSPRCVMAVRKLKFKVWDFGRNAARIDFTKEQLEHIVSALGHEWYHKHENFKDYPELQETLKPNRDLAYELQELLWQMKKRRKQLS